MKKLFFIILLFQALLSLKAQDKDSIIVTHVGNCGFMIEMDSTKIIIDGLFRDGLSIYSAPDSSITQLMRAGAEPFNNIDYVIVTHKHADHFDSRLVSEFMCVNEQCRLVCPGQVIEELMKKEAEKFNEFSSRLLECTPEEFMSKTFINGNLKIIGYRLGHMHESNKDIENIAYYIELKPLSLFHTGDSDPGQLNEYTGAPPSDNPCDIAFVNTSFCNLKYYQFSNSFIGAKKIIAMHFPKDFFHMQHEKISDLPDDYIEPVVFKEMMEKQVFYIEK